MVVCIITENLSKSLEPESEVSYLKVYKISYISIPAYLGWYRYHHGVPPMKWDKGLEDKARQGAKTLCTYGFSHHKGTETDQASLFWHSKSCDKVMLLTVTIYNSF